jgi:hypothetical protein
VTLALALIWSHLEGAAVVLERAVAIAGTEGDRVFAAVTRTLNRVPNRVRAVDRRRARRCRRRSPSPD